MSQTNRPDQPKENKMGSMPMNRLLLDMSLPIMAAMLVQAMYNLVDSIFVARISQKALAAVSLAFPVQSFIISVGVGTGVGVSSLLSRRLGQKRREDALAVAHNGLVLAAASGAVFAVAGYFGSAGYFRYFSDDAELVAMGSAYTVICTMFASAQLMSMVGARVAQATGNTTHSMISQMAGAVTNIILDPILIFGLLGFPRLEVAGAAIATVIGQSVSFVMIIYLNKFKNNEISLAFGRLRPRAKVMADIYRVGLPSIVLQSIGPVMIFSFNRILISFTPLAITVLGVYFKLQGFVFMPVFGLCAGMVPVVAYNYGARRPERIMSAITMTCKMAGVVMAAGLILFQIFSGWFLKTLFDAPDDMLAIGVPALRIISIHFVPAAVSIVLSSVFQAMGNGIYSLFMSFTRQIGIIIPVGWLLGRLLGLGGVWWSFPIAEVVSISMALFLFKRIYKEKIECMIIHGERCDNL